MTPRQRLLRTLTGKPVDRVPWSPFLAYYFENLPADVQQRGQLEYLEKIGADPLLRGEGSCYFKWRYNGNITRREEPFNGGKREIFETKVGTLSQTVYTSGVSRTSLLKGHPVKTEEDLKVLMYLYENIEIEPSIDEFEALNRRIGERGLPLPLVGVMGKTAFQSMVESWFGTEALAYALCDFPELIRECLEIMWEKDMETIRLAGETSAEALLFFEDSSTTNISPSMFKNYTLPEINAWGRALHASGKMLVHHACGHLKGLAPLIAESEIDVLESVSPKPTGNIEIEDIAKLLPERIALIGGIEPLFFETCTMEDLEKRVRCLLDAMKGTRFVLANSDSCPPGVTEEKLRFVSRTAREIQGF